MTNITWDEQGRRFVDGQLAPEHDGPPTRTELLDRIVSLVTGDGAQLENLSMSDEEWRHEAREQTGDDMQVAISLPVEEWLAFVHIAQRHSAR